MKISKKIMVCLLLFALLFTTAGCVNKEAITYKDFKNTLEDKDFTVVDATEKMSEYDYVEKVYIAINENETYQIEFYELSTEDFASTFYGNNKEILEDTKSSVYTETSVSLGNYAKYTLTNNGKFSVVSRIDNTVIYLNVKEGYKDEVKEILDELDY